MAISEQFKQHLVALRGKKGWTQEEVARKVGMSLSGYQKIEQTGRTTGKMLNRLAELYEMDVPMLVTGRQENKGALPMRRIPILNSIPASGFKSSFADIGAEEWMYTDIITNDNLFALRVKGDSMSPRIENNDIAILLPDQPFENGGVYAVIANEDEATLKVVRKIEGGYLLIPANPAFETLFVPTKKLLRLYRVIEVLKKNF